MFAIAKYYLKMLSKSYVGKSRPFSSSNPMFSQSKPLSPSVETYMDNFLIYLSFFPREGVSPITATSWLVTLSIEGTIQCKQSHSSFSINLNTPIEFSFSEVITNLATSPTCMDSTMKSIKNTAIRMFGIILMMPSITCQLLPLYKVNIYNIKGVYFVCMEDSHLKYLLSISWDPLNEMCRFLQVGPFVIWCGLILKT